MVQAFTPAMNERRVWTYNSMEDLGWDDRRREEFEADWSDRDCIPGRIAVRHKSQYDVLTTGGAVEARIKGHLRYRAESRAELPVVGDWVVLDRKGHDHFWRIHGLMERRTALRRKVQGIRTDAQILAANVDTVLIVMGLTEDFNIRRLERYLTLVHESGAEPVIVLNKADLLDEEWLADSLGEVREVSGEAEVVLTSALDRVGVEDIRPYLRSGETVVFVGSSGAGKSTLINALLGRERQATGEVRERDGRGRHTTTQRELLILPDGGVLIDSPGIREIQLFEADEGLAETFADIEELAKECRFRDCTHTAEPGCAVMAAIEEGDLEASRVDSWRSLAKEGERISQRKGEWGEKKRVAFREIAKARRQINKDRP